MATQTTNGIKLRLAISVFCGLLVSLIIGIPVFAGVIRTFGGQEPVGDLASLILIVALLGAVPIGAGIGTFAGFCLFAWLVRTDNRINPHRHNSN
jgi:hypothetical protein